MRKHLKDAVLYLLMAGLLVGTFTSHKLVASLAIGAALIGILLLSRREEAEDEAARESAARWNNGVEYRRRIFEPLLYCASGVSVVIALMGFGGIGITSVSVYISGSTANAMVVGIGSAVCALAPFFARLARDRFGPMLSGATMMFALSTALGWSGVPAIWSVSALICAVCMCLIVPFP